MNDIRYSLRSLGKSSGFTAIAMLTLALCIGANSAIFSVVNAILLRPYPWPDSERLVFVYNTYPLMNLPNAGTSVPDYLDRKTGVAAFEDAAMYTNQAFNLASDGEPERIVGLRATPSLFTTLQSQASLGRVFGDAQAEPGNEKVVVLSHALWRDRFGADHSVVGTTIRLNSLLIVGVVAPIKFQGLDEDVTKESLYYPFAQVTGTNLFIAARAAGDPLEIAPSLRDAVRSVDPDQPVADIKTMTQRMEDASLSRRAPMVLLGLFSGVALLLAVLGVYGVLAFAVAQRTPEFGVRMALGATRRSIADLVLRQGAWLVGIGVACGLGAFLALSSVVGRLLYGIAPTDPLSLTIAPLVLMFAAVAACIVPVRRATGVSPLEALRVD